ncbi:hypothetical protein [Deminuibacter soli]|uniref:hypothetical protein n=1 Tax=Deminuibacter soli TaxID=2291815 RepID=UPI0011C1058F|nr:hypothetical protein [Deminuibacter soli]
MKIIVVATLLTGLMLTACTGKNTNQEPASHTASDSAVVSLYKGDFDGSPIYITINYHNGNKVAGYNVHKGLKRNITGELLPTANGFTATLDEPGDNPYDGHFIINFDTAFAKATASWSPVKPDGPRAKDFTLARATSPKRQYEIDEVGYDPFTDGGMMAGDHSDINFEKDGSCLLTYYAHITDSTYVDQLTTVKGTWEVKNNQVLVNWQPNETFKKTNTVFDFSFYQNDDGKKYLNGIKGEGFDFSIIVD